MTDQELKDIVSAVVAELEKSGVDFDYKAEQAKDDDLVFVIRGTAPNYQGVTVTWKGLLDIITAQATQAKNDAETAKNTANTILEQVQSKGTEITNFVATSKTEIETQKNESVNAVKSVYQTDLDELKGDLDTERNARIEADTEHSTRLQKVEVASSVNRYEIDNLKAKAEGKLYRTETVEAEAYALDVPPSVAPYAEVQKIGGKSVVWNQLVDIPKYDYSTAVQLYKIFNTITKNGHKYFLKIKNNGSAPIRVATGGEISQIASDNVSNGYSRIFTGTGKESAIVLHSDGTSGTGTVYTLLIDLTQMFGSGNEPTLKECQKIFSAEYYPYDAGTIKSFPVKIVRSLNAEGTEIGSMDASSVTADFKSAGSVHDEWSNGKVTKRIGAVDLGTLDWRYAKTGSGRFEVEHIGIKGASSISVKANVLCPKYESRTAQEVYSGTTGIAVNGSTIWIHDSSYTDVSKFKSAMSGVMLYYELVTPTEETVPEIDNYIQVEGGGTLRFESDDTVHMPVPSTTRFVVDLTSTTEEETT